MNSDFQSLLQLAIAFNVGIVAYAAIFRNSLQHEGDRVKMMLEFAERRRSENLKNCINIVEEKNIVDETQGLLSNIEQQMLFDENYLNNGLASFAFICVIPSLFLLLFGSFYAESPAADLVRGGAVLFNMPLVLFILYLGYHRHRVVRPFVRKRDGLRVRLNRVVRGAAQTQ